MKEAAPPRRSARLAAAPPYDKSGLGSSSSSGSKKKKVADPVDAAVAEDGKEKRRPPTSTSSLQPDQQELPHPPPPRTYGRRRVTTAAAAAAATSSVHASSSSSSSGARKAVAAALYDPTVPLSPGFKRARPVRGAGTTTTTTATTTAGGSSRGLAANPWESPPPSSTSTSTSSGAAAVSRRKQQQAAKRRRVGLVAGAPEETADGPAFSNVGLDDDPPPAAAAAAGGGGSGDEGSSVPPRPTAPSTPVAVLSRDVWFPSLRRLRVVAEDVAGGSCVVMVATGEEYGHRRRVEQLLAIVNDDLGWNMSNDAPGEEEKIFIFVSKVKQAIGCLVVERVEQAFRVVGEQGDECSTQPEPAVMGISRIWVHEEHRRKGVATKLLDAARAHFVYGYLVRKSECAFTQPTRDGHSLASRYFGLKQFLVYK